MNTKFYKRKEAAQLLNISIPTLDRLINEGAISFIDVGSGRYRVPRFTDGHIDAFVSKNEQKAI